MTHGAALRTAAILGLILTPIAAAHGACSQDGRSPSFLSTLGEETAPLTGRLYVMISHTKEPEVRLQDYGYNSPEILGADVTDWRPGRAVGIDGKTPGYPFQSLCDLPAGHYFVQSVFAPYDKYPRADGHTVWALPQWTGHVFNDSPGVRYSRMQAWESNRGDARVRLALTRVVAEQPTDQDTPWVRHVRIQSELLSKFWGRPIYLGAVVLLPRNYDVGSAARYPVIYQQQAHFGAGAPFGFRGPDQSDFGRAWAGGGFPRVIAVALQHPTPYADYSAAEDSSNNGPYATAILQELVPFIEHEFRIRSDPGARAIVGKSLGGRDALSLLLRHPQDFAGAWIFYPWGIDFTAYGRLNLYVIQNAFEIRSPESPSWMGFWNGVQWTPLARFAMRTVDDQPLATWAQLSAHDAVIDPHFGGELGAENAILGPVGAQGYPAPIWDPTTGQIDPAVLVAWREHGDLLRYIQAQWPTIGPSLIGKLHFYVGEMDEFYRQGAVHHFDEFLQSAQPDFRGTFAYGAAAGHGWQPMSDVELVRMIASNIVGPTPSKAPP